MEVTEEFVEYASEGSLAIEVWGNRMKGFDSQKNMMVNWNVEPQQKGLHDRYQNRGMRIGVFVFVFSVKGFIPGVISSRWSAIVRVSVVRSRNFFLDSDWRFDNLCSGHVQSVSKLVVSRQLMVSNSGYWPVRSIKSRCYSFLVFKCALFRSQRLYMC